MCVTLFSKFLTFIMMTVVITMAISVGFSNSCMYIKLKFKNII